MVSMSPHALVFDRRLLHDRHRRAAALGASTFLMKRVAQELADRLASVLRRFEWALDLGTPTDAVCRELAGSGKIGTIVTTTATASNLDDRFHGSCHSGAPRSGESGIHNHRPGVMDSGFAALRASPRNDGVYDSNFGNAALEHVPRLEQQTGSGGPGARCLAVAADEEALPFRDASLDLIVSALSLHFVNDLPGTLLQIRRALKPDGLFLAALAGGDTLTELRQSFATAEAEIEDGISPRVISFVDVRAAGALLQRAGFALPVTDLDRITVRYDSPMALMRDLRAMGATNPMVERSRRPLKRSTLKRTMDIYAERFADPDKRIRATFEIVWLCGWAPHSSQQKPLAPGSAQQRLADVLGVKESSAGEKAQR
jgi:SAM-dependent methyltransferase